MTSAHLIQWIKHPETLDKESLYELRTLLVRYPYFQTLRLLYLKNLYLLHDAAFGEELRRSVLYVTDHRQLFYQIEGDRYQLQPHQPAVVTGSEAVAAGADRTLYLIDSFLSTVPEEQTQATELDYAMDYTTYLLEQSDGGETVNPVAEEVTPLLRGQDLIDSFLSRAGDPLFSLDEEIRVSAAVASVEKGMSGPVRIEADRNTSEEEWRDSSVKATSSVEISEFAETAETETVSELTIASSAETTVCSTGYEEELSDDDGGENEEKPVEDETFTETLAKIYVKQHRYDKALEIIKKLSLNYPKKNAYFADQIRFLEKLIINAKSK